MAKKRKTDPELNSVPQPNESPNDSDTDLDSDSESDSEDMKKLLDPFTKDQLIDLLSSAASSDPKLAEEIHRVADRDPSHRKIFVHGLGWETTGDKLRSFFSQYGEIDDCNVVADKVTGKSKGYGFLLFKHRRGAQKALKEPQKKIDSRMTACQLATIGPVSGSHLPPSSMPSSSSSSLVQETLLRKIYVGNVHAEIPADRLLSFFSKYGEIEEGPLGFDKVTGKPRGFALFIYKSVEGAQKALEEPNKNFEGHQLYCQKATDSHKLRASAASTAAPGHAGFNLPDANLSHQASALLGQGLMGPFGQNQAALAVLAAAGQNPAAFGVSPAVIASLNPALAAAMNIGGPQMPAQAMPQSYQGFGMGSAGYQGTSAHQAAAHPYQSGQMGQASGTRPHHNVGPMGGYGAR